MFIGQVLGSCVAMSPCLPLSLFFRTMLLPRLPLTRLAFQS